MAAAAHQQVDAPVDREEAEMAAAAFEAIERAHQLCDHAPARRELPADLGNSELSNRAHGHVLPPQRAAAICLCLCEELNEGALLKDLDAETATPIFPLENSDMDDEYDGSTFAAACRKADARARTRPVPAEIQRARRLLDDDVSLERAYAELGSSHTKEGRAFRRRGRAQ
jgi:hypothetical protein